MFAPQSVSLPTWARALAIVAGIFAIIVAILFLIFPGLALATFVLLVGFFLLVFGIERIAAGISGHSLRWAPVGAPQGGTPPTSGNSPPTP